MSIGGDVPTLIEIYPKKASIHPPTEKFYKIIFGILVFGALRDYLICVGMCCIIVLMIDRRAVR